MSELPSHSARYQDLPPRARSYVDNLIAQRDEIFRNAGLPEGTTFGTITKEQVRMIDWRDHQRLKDIGEEILRVGKTKEAPKEWSNWEYSFKEALEILGPDSAFGPEAVEKTFGIKLESKDIPPIPFSKAELERAKELNQFLILRVDKAPDGQPLTMKKMGEIVSPGFDQEGKGKVFFGNMHWDYQRETFTTPKLRPSAGRSFQKRSSRARQTRTMSNRPRRSSTPSKHRCSRISPSQNSTKTPFKSLNLRKHRSPV